MGILRKGKKGEIWGPQRKEKFHVHLPLCSFPLHWLKARSRIILLIKNFKLLWFDFDLSEKSFLLKTNLTVHNIMPSEFSLSSNNSLLIIEAISLELLSFILCLNYDVWIIFSLALYPKSTSSFLDNFLKWIFKMFHHTFWKNLRC